jgi:diguanylate cyclase (GGDEF)-like protein
VAGGVAVFASYLAVLLGPADEVTGGRTALGIILPGVMSAAVLIIYATWENRNYTRVKGMADELSAQLVRKEIEIGRLATVDELTGLFTRREFEETLKLEFERARRHTRGLSLIVVEIDDIAELGERVGSLSKSFVLSEVSAILRTQLRANDAGCRYTNESLALLLPETGEAQAVAVAQKLQALVAGHKFLGQLAGGVELTVSQGIATMVPGMERGERLQRAAEAALATARSAGFNRIEVFRAAPGADELPLAS